MIDYHLHLENGPFTLEWLTQFWQHAQKRGITEIGITEHCHKFREFYPMFAPLIEGENTYPFMAEWISRDFRSEMDQYIELLLTARKQGIPVKIGLELDFLPGTEDFARNLLKNYPFDFILGSVHVIDKWGFDYKQEVWDNHDVDQAYHDYYRTLLEAVNSGLFDIVAHLDLIKVFGHKPVNFDSGIVAAVLEQIAKKQLSLELSSAGWRKPVNEVYPAEWIVAEAGLLQIPITFASDAHYPQDVGFAWEKLVSMAKRCGYREYSVYTNRERRSERIPK